MSAAATADERDEKKKKHRDPAREVVETIVFVVVLVLLLKLFVTEAFVIPTGSMAETLYGYQKIITCGKCGHQFPVNSHDEVEVNAQTGKKHQLVGYCCPNCRYQYQGKGSEGVIPRDNRTGDRVLVLKPLYHLTRPQRGDVVVFKYPEEPQQKHTAQNYIKRAMGFGNETVAIFRGELFYTTSLAYPEDARDADGRPLYPRPEDPLDLWRPDYMYFNNAQGVKLFEASRAAGFTDKVPGGFQIVRKGEKHVLADLRLVWDNDKQPKDLPAVVGAEYKDRWYADGPGWNGDAARQPRAFAHTGDALTWVRYRHLAWQQDASGKLAHDAFGRLVPWRWPEQGGKAPLPGPVDNMLGYNAGIELNPDTGRQQPGRETGLETHWVGDLALECEAELGGGAEVVLELSKGVNRFQAKFAGGQVALARIGPLAQEFGTPSRPCKVNAGTYKLRFANVDARLMVWVNDRRIDFGTEADYIPAEPKEYDPDDAQKEGWTRENDIEKPASIGAKGQVTIRGLKLLRDIYYTRSGGDQSAADVYYVQPGHYLCLGDNSAQSSDSRKWGTVPERLMLGKAVFVFWPAYPPPNRVGFIK